MKITQKKMKIKDDIVKVSEEMSSYDQRKKIKGSSHWLEDALFVSKYCATHVKPIVRTIIGFIPCKCTCSHWKYGFSYQRSIHLPYGSCKIEIMTGSQCCSDKLWQSFEVLAVRKDCL